MLHSVFESWEDVYDFDGETLILSDVVMKKSGDRYGSVEINLSTGETRLVGDDATVQDIVWIKGFVES